MRKFYPETQTLSRIEPNERRSCSLDNLVAWHNESSALAAEIHRLTTALVKISENGEPITECTLRVLCSMSEQLVSAINQDFFGVFL